MAGISRVKTKNRGRHDPPMRRLLVVDDEPDIVATVAAGLQRLCGPGVEC